MQARQDAEQLAAALDLALADLAAGTIDQRDDANKLNSAAVEPQWCKEKPIWDRMEMELARQV